MSIVKQNRVIIRTEFEYAFNDASGLYELKSDEPVFWTAEEKKFKTLEELIIYLQLNCIDNEHLLIGMRQKEEKMFIDAWKEANSEK